MFKYSITIGGNSLAELRASAAAFAGATEPVAVHVTASDTGGLAAAIAPAADTDDDTGAADANAPEFDAAGIPWDERIHAGTKGRNQDGTWKRRRNTSDVQFASVMAELSARKAGQQPAAAPVAAPAAAPVTASPDSMAASPVVIPSTPAPVVQAAPMAPAANVAPVPAPAAAPAPAIPAAPAAPVAATPAPVAAETASPAAPPAGGGMQFAVFMPKFAHALNTGRFSQDDLKGYLQSWGLTDIGQISTDPIKVEQFYNWLRAANPPLID